MINSTTITIVSVELARVFSRLIELKRHEKKQRKLENYVPFSPSSETAALRRASLDLTRALVELRKTK